MGRRGDSFTGRGGGSDESRTLIQSDELRWSDRIEYLIRSIAGDNLPDKLRSVVWIFAKEIGKLSDGPANPTTIAATPATEYSLVSLGKAALLQDVEINSELDSIDDLLAQVNTNLDTTNQKLVEVEAAIVVVQGKIDGTNAALTAIGLDVAGIKAAIELTASSLLEEQVGTASITHTGKFHWISWECGLGTNRMELSDSDNAVIIAASNLANGVRYFDPPIGGNFVLTCTSSSSVPVIISAGVSP